MKALVTVLLLLLVSPAQAQDRPGDEEASTTTQLRFEGKRLRRSFAGDGAIALQGGALSGDGIQAAGGPAIAADVSLFPRFFGPLGRVGLRLDVKHRQSLGFGLAEGKADLGILAEFTPGPFSARGDVGLVGVWRPRWEDPYQPTAEGELLLTDRFSYFGPRLGGRFAVYPHDAHRIVFAYELARLDYPEAPNYDPADPNHLSPGSHTKNEVDLYWRFAPDGVRLEVGARLAHKAYSDRPARDAGTGLTHASASSSTPSNPLASEVDVEPRVAVRIALPKVPVELRMGYTLEIQEDLYEGYYSYLGHNPSLGVVVDVEDRFELASSIGVILRRYGPDSYEEGSKHPPLDQGERRTDNRYRADLDVRIPIREHWTVLVDSSLLVRRTNFPDYEPGVFPSKSQYEISWDYENWTVMAGIELAFGARKPL